MSLITHWATALASWQNHPRFQREVQSGWWNNKGHYSVKQGTKTRLGKAYLERKGGDQKAPCWVQSMWYPLVHWHRWKDQASAYIWIVAGVLISHFLRFLHDLNSTKVLEVMGIAAGEIPAQWALSALSKIWKFGFIWERMMWEPWTRQCKGHGFPNQISVQWCTSYVILIMLVSLLESNHGNRQMRTDMPSL